MPDLKISQLTDKPTPVGADVGILVDSVGGANKKFSFSTMPISTAVQTALDAKVGGTGTSGHVSYWSGTSSQAGSANLFWDNSNNRLGIGTNAPSQSLDIRSLTDVGATTGDLLVNTQTPNPKITLGRQSSTAFSSIALDIIDRSGTSVFSVNRNNGQAGGSISSFAVGALLGFGTNAATHAVTFASTSTGSAFYGTSDQVTNFERMRHVWDGTRYLIGVENGGTGIIRTLRVATRNQAIYIDLNNSPSSSPALMDFNTTATAWSPIAGTSIYRFFTAITGTSLVEPCLTVTPTITQSGTAGYTGIMVSAFESSVGTGSRLLLSLGTNSAAGGAIATHTSRFRVDILGNIVTSSTATSGHTYFNTVDQATNSEKVSLGFQTNRYIIESTSTGTGSIRPVLISVGTTRLFETSFTPSVGKGIFDFNQTTSSQAGSILSLNGALSGTNTSQIAIQVTPTVSQSSTATFRGIYVSPFLSSVGASALLLDVGTNTATANGGTHSSVFSIGSTGKVSCAATNTAGGTTGARTINNPSGTVNFAAAATSLVVTNNLVTTSSIVFAVVRTNDSTAVIKNVVPASGSFTITLNAAATAETSVGFFVIN